MPRYFFHLRSADGSEMTDDVGTLLEHDLAAVHEAIGTILDLTRQARVNWHECTFQILDEKGGEVAKVRFDDVLSFEDLTPFGEQRRHYLEAVQI